MIRIIITFVNQIFLQLIDCRFQKYDQSFKKYKFVKKLDKQRESFSPNTDNFLPFFFWMGQNFEKCNG